MPCCANRSNRITRATADDDDIELFTHLCKTCYETNLARRWLSMLHLQPKLKVVVALSSQAKNLKTIQW
jgi:hypothetical protein